MNIFLDIAEVPSKVEAFQGISVDPTFTTQNQCLKGLPLKSPPSFTHSVSMVQICSQQHYVVFPQVALLANSFGNREIVATQ